MYQMVFDKHFYLLTTPDQEQQNCFQHSRGRSGDQYMSMGEEGKFQ